MEHQRTASWGSSFEWLAGVVWEMTLLLTILVSIVLMVCLLRVIPWHGSHLIHLWRSFLQFQQDPDSFVRKNANSFKDATFPTSPTSGGWQLKCFTSRHGTGETTKWHPRMRLVELCGDFHEILWHRQWYLVSQTVDFILVREKWNSVSQHCWKGRFAGTVVLGNTESRRISSWDCL